MLLEVFRVHSENFKKAAEIEAFNNSSFSIHPDYQKKVIEIDLHGLLVMPRYKMARDGWFSKTVHEVFNPHTPEALPLFIRRPAVLHLVARNQLHFLV